MSDGMENAWQDLMANGAPSLAEVKFAKWIGALGGIQESSIGKYPT